MQFDCKACSGRWWEVERTYGVYDVKIYIYIYISGIWVVWKNRGRSPFPLGSGKIYNLEFACIRVTVLPTCVPFYLFHFH